MKKIMLSLFTIAAVAVLATGATSAYFSDQKTVSGNTFSTGTVTIGADYTAPISVSGLYPGATITSNLTSVKYTGSLKGDLYFGFKQVSGGDVLGDVLSFQVVNADNNVAVTGWLTADYPYNNWVKLADGLNNGNVVNYKVNVSMSSSAVNTLQGKTALANIVFYAVQDNGTAPATPPVSFPL